VAVGTGQVVITGQRSSGKSINLNSASRITGNGLVVLDALNGEISSGSNDYLTANELLLLNASKATLGSTQNDINTFAANNIGSGGLVLVDQDSLSVGAIDWGGNDYQGLQASGKLSVSTLTDNLSVAKDIQTASTAADAILLIAGRNEAAGTKTGGDIRIDGAKITAGTGGRAVLYTGSIDGSSGLT